MKHLFLMTLVVCAVVGCGSIDPTTTPNLDATVDAQIASLMATVSVTSTPTLLQTIDPAIAALPTPTTVVDATVVPLTLAPTATVPLTSVIQRIRPAVVRIETPLGSGTGVIIETAGETGIVITNFHVIEGADLVRVTVNDLSVFEATVRGVDQVRDLAVLNICCGSFEAMDFGDASQIQVRVIVEPESVLVGQPLAAVYQPVKNLGRSVFCRKTPGRGGSKSLKRGIATFAIGGFMHFLGIESAQSLAQKIREGAVVEGQTVRSKPG